MEPANIKNIFDYKESNDPENASLDGSISIKKLEEYSSLSLKTYQLNREDVNFRINVTEAIKKYCVNEDFLYYKRAVFKQASDNEYGLKIEELAKKQELCSGLISKSLEVWNPSLSKEESPALSTLNVALINTKNKIILDRKILITINDIRVGKFDKTKQVDESLPLNMYATKFLKTEELVTWRAYDKHKMQTVVEVSFAHKAVSWLVIGLTVIAIFFKLKSWFWDKTPQEPETRENSEDNPS